MVFVCHPASAADEEPCAKRIITRLVGRAYRRPVSEVDVAPILEFYRAGRREGSFDQGVESAVVLLLTSPQFLFRVERDQKGVAPGRGVAFPWSPARPPPA